MKVVDTFSAQIENRATSASISERYPGFLKLALSAGLNKADYHCHRTARCRSKINNKEALEDALFQAFCIQLIKVSCQVR